MTTTDLEVRPPGPPATMVPATPGISWDWDQAWNLANKIARTEFVPTALRGKPESVMACVLAGQELALGPMQALQSIHVIEGKVALSAELMRALIARAGHRLDIVETGDTRVVIKGQRRDTGATAEVAWSLDDARQANLTGKQVWKAYPRAMLLARATSELARSLFPDVIAGMGYTPEEIESIAPGEHSWSVSTVEPSASAADAAQARASGVYTDASNWIQFGRVGTIDDRKTILRAFTEQADRKLTVPALTDDIEWCEQLATWLQARRDDEQDIIDAEPVIGEFDVNDPDEVV